jgi:hypothetical protein
MGIVAQKVKNADKLIGRLFNWKFEQAALYIEGQPVEVCELVKALSATFGNEGWGECGHIGTIVSAAVDRLIDGESVATEEVYVEAEDDYNRVRST